MRLRKINVLRQTGVAMLTSARRFVAGYYVANALLLCSYLLVRQYFYSQERSPYTRLQSHAELEYWERQVAGLFVAAVVVKYLRSPSLEAFLSTVFLYGKTAMAVLTFQIDMRVFAYFAILNILIYMTCPQPEYQGPDKIERLTPLQLRSCIEDSQTSGVTWLVEFYAAWSPACIHLEPVFAELSLKYRTETLRFAKLDLSRSPGVAKEYRIDLSGASPQVPSFVMFHKGKEIGRIPHIYANGSIAKGRYRKADLIRAFDLDKRFATSMNKAPKASTQTSRKKQ